MTYRPEVYWSERGMEYAAKFEAERYQEQEQLLAHVFGTLEFQSVLDVGCGFGRMLDVLSRSAVLEFDYTGIDLSAEVLDSARGLHPGYAFEQADLITYARQGPDLFDLVVACEVLMHVPPQRLQQSVWALGVCSSKHLVTVDWTEPVEGPVSEHNFLHDYSRAFDPRQLAYGATITRFPAGLQTIHVVSRP